MGHRNLKPLQISQSVFADDVAIMACKEEDLSELCPCMESNADKAWIEN